MRIFGLILALVLLLPLAACDKHARDKKEIQSSWAAYRDAAKNAEGAAAAGLLSKSTLEFYGRLVKMAPDATSSQCWALRPTELVQLADLRTHYTRKEVAGLSGESYVARSIKDGRWGTYGPEWQLRNIAVSADGATATAVICNPDAESDYGAKKFVGAYSRTARRMNRAMGAPPVFPAAFVKDGELWKYDETATLAEQDKELLQQAKDEGMPIREYVVLLNSELGEAKAETKVWEPMKK